MDFADYGIIVPPGTGEADTTCPECSQSRKKKNDKCLSVNRDEGTWLCHHCGWSGGLKRRKEWGDGYYKPRKIYTKPEYTPPLELPQEVIDWFALRGIMPETLAREDIGYSQGWVQFPYYRGGECVNIKYRKLGEKDFRQEKDAEKVLYGMDSIPHDCETLIWTEGEMDRLALVQCGYRNVVSVPDGAPAPNSKSSNLKFEYLENCETFISRFRQHILAVDSDPPGQKLEAELSRRLGMERCLRVTWPSGCKDANDVLVHHGRVTLDERIRDARYLPVEGIFEIRDIISDAALLYDEGITRGVSTGWHSLDRYLTIRPSEFCVVTGSPSSGKSSLVDHLMVNLALNEGWRCGVYSPENAPLAQHFKRLAEVYIGKSFLPGKYARMSPAEVIEAGRFLSQHFYFIASSDTMLTTTQILEKAKILVYRHGINFLVVDPFNDIDQSDLQGDNETNRISSMLSKLQRFARVHNVFVALVAHPTKTRRDERTGEYPVVTLRDVAGSANFFNRCDVGMSCHRPSINKDYIELHIQKIRHKEVGEPGMVRLDYSRANGRFSDHVGMYYTNPKERAQARKEAEIEARASLAELYDGVGDSNQ
jgi:twinkle protein